MQTISAPAEKGKTMTNLEYIRSAELGKLADLLFDLASCPYEDFDCTCFDSCRECWENWLESERREYDN